MYVCVSSVTAEIKSCPPGGIEGEGIERAAPDQSDAGGRDDVC